MIDRNFFKKRFFSPSGNPGSAPGTIHYSGEKRIDDIRIEIYDYDEQSLYKATVESIEECKPYIEKPSKTWIRVYGLHDVETLQSIWNQFELHPLIQEDIVNLSQRPKVEYYDNCTFFVLRMFYISDETDKLEAEQINLVLGENYMLSFQETDTPLFNPVQKRLEIKDGRLRKLDTDYLAYALIDTVVDHYFNVMELIADRIETLEDLLMEDPDTDTLHGIHRVRREVIFFRKSIWPLRDMLNSVIRDESAFVHDSTKIYLRDVYDHIVQIIDSIENFRDMAVSMHDMYMSYVSNRMNEVMKVLTIIATIFIPLTFIAGVYGMNFDPHASPYNMPELNWYWGYPAALGLMLVIGIAMMVYFKRKDWL